MKQENAAVSNIKRWARERRKTLLAAGIATVAGYYSGEGDEGALQYVDFLGPLEESAEAFQKDTVEELFEALHAALAPGGYENNEGGGGEFRLDVATGAITHQSYVLSTERFDRPEENY